VAHLFDSNNLARSPDGAQRNPGWAFPSGHYAAIAGTGLAAARLFPDYATLHPGYEAFFLYQDGMPFGSFSPCVVAWGDQCRAAPPRAPIP
jgi:hypothetical protein